MANSIQQIIFGTLSAITGALGVPGNILVLVIYLPQCQRGSSKVLVVWMAALDLLCSLFVALPQSYQLLTDIQVEPLCRVKNFLLVASSFVTFQVTAVVAVDRYLVICHPHRKLMTVRRAHVVIAANCVVGVIVSIPTLLFFQVIEVGNGRKICTIVRQFLPGLRALGFARFGTFFALAIAIIILYLRIAVVVRRRPKVGTTEVRSSEQNPAARSTDIAKAPSNVTGLESSHPLSSGSQLKNSNTESGGYGLSGSSQDLQKTVQAPSTSGEVSWSIQQSTTKETYLDTDHYLHKAAGNLLSVPDERPVSDVSGSDNASSDNPSDVSAQFEGDRKSGLQSLARVPLRAKTNKKKEETYADRVRNKTSMMLLVIAIIVVITYAPQILAIVVGTKLSRSGALRNLMVDLTSFVALVNSAVNPLIYTFLNSKFRTDVKNTWRKLRSLVTRW